MAHEVAAPVAAKHIHVRLHFDDGSVLAYADPRRFGFMDLVDGQPLTIRLFWPVWGRSHWAMGFTKRPCWPRVRGARARLKTFLLDQRVVAGLGNIYVCEALFDAPHQPAAQRLADNLGPKRAARLVPAIRSVLQPRD